VCRQPHEHTGILGIKEAVPGKDLQLTIDLDLQVVAELAMQGRRGAVVALDPRSGEILALVSAPSYDSNQFVGRVNSRELVALLNDPGKPMFNRAVQAQLAPGSTFKPLVAIAGLESGVIDENTTVHCSGGASFYGRYFKCHKKGGHGTVSLHRALAQSCDVYFYTIGNRMGIDTIAKYAELAGLGRKTGIDLPGEKEGVMPSSRWKIRTLRRNGSRRDTRSRRHAAASLQRHDLMARHWQRPMARTCSEAGGTAAHTTSKYSGLTTACMPVNEGGPAERRDPGRRAIK
jgi:penicillin-binding protein 2